MRHRDFITIMAGISDVNDSAKASDNSLLFFDLQERDDELPGRRGVKE